jgi:hypothetical protein
VRRRSDVDGHRSLTARTTRAANPRLLFDRVAVVGRHRLDPGLGGERRRQAIDIDPLDRSDIVSMGHLATVGTGIAGAATAAALFAHLARDRRRLNRLGRGGRFRRDRLLGHLDARRLLFATRASILARAILTATVVAAPLVARAVFPRAIITVAIVPTAIAAILAGIFGLPRRLLMLMLMLMRLVAADIPIVETVLVELVALIATFGELVTARTLLLEAGAVLVEDAEIMIGELEIIFDVDPIALHLGIARQ